MVGEIRTMDMRIWWHIPSFSEIFGQERIYHTWLDVKSIDNEATPMRLASTYSSNRGPVILSPRG
jgi:hypothetical protein